MKTFLGIGCGLPIAVGLIIGLIIAVAPKDSKPSEGDAIVACEQAIRDQLKSPSTASFNSAVSGNGPFTVIGSVDAENSFGATVRADYQCTVNGRLATIDYFTG